MKLRESICRVLSFAVISVIVLSCSDSEDRTICIKPKSNDFGKVTDAIDQSFELPCVIDIEDWTFNEEGLLCRSRHADQVYYCFDPDSFKLIKSMGKRGEGPDEYINPQLVRSTDKRTIVADVAKRKFWVAADDDTTELSVPSLHVFNNIIDINYPIVGFTEFNHEGQTWYTMDLQNNTIVDSIVFENSQYKDVPLSLDVDSHAGSSVFVREFTDEFYIADVNDEGRISNIRLFRGDGEIGKNRPYYVDVSCGKDYFCLLSMRNIDFNSKEVQGKAEIELYDYSGNPLMKYICGFFPSKIILDSESDRLFLLSAFDDSVHVINLDI